MDVPFEVQKPQDGWRLDAFLAARLRGYSRSRVQALIRDGLVLRAGGKVKASAPVRAGQSVVIRYPRRPEPPPAALSLTILHEDEALLAVDKPAGVLSHPTDKIVANAVTSLLRAQRPELSPRLAHRLDRETSGVLLLAKTAEAARRLNLQFLAREVRKEYLAVVHGRVEWRRRLVEAPIGREGGAVKVRQAAGRGQAAATEFERRAAGERFSLVVARPRTGRLHQIRVHLAHVGHPVVGDKLYTEGGVYYLKAVAHSLTADDLAALGAERQLLHAWSLSLAHPLSGAPLRLEAPIPADFKPFLSLF